MSEQKSFIKHVLTLLSGNISAQALLFLANLLLARLYTPEVFGFLAVFSATVLIVGELSNARFELALFLPKLQSEAIQLLWLCLIITAALVLFSVLITFLVLPFFLSGTLLYYFNFFPIALLFVGSNQAFSAYLNRSQKYAAISFSRFIQAVVLSAVSLGAYKMGAHVSGLLWGLIAGQLAAVLILAMVSIKIVSKESFAPINFSIIRALTKKYYTFPRFSTASTLLNTVSRQSPVYILGFFFGTEVVGQFSMAYRLLTTPVMLVAGAYGQVFFEKASGLEREQPQAFPAFIKKNVLLLFVLGLLPTLAIAMYGVPFTVMLLGDKWLAAGKFITLLAPWTLLLFINNPLSFVFSIKNKLKIELVYHFLIFSLRVIALVIGGVLASALYAVGLFSGVGVVFNIFMIWYIMRISGIKKWKKSQ